VATAEEDRLSIRAQSIHFFFFAAASDALLQHRPHSTPAPTAPAIDQALSFFPRPVRTGVVV
jgi:hypothetical protein